MEPIWKWQMNYDREKLTRRFEKPIKGIILWKVKCLDVETSTKVE